jgi:hypothetical protein
MRTFTLIDLWHQAAYLPAEMRRWTPDEFATWLARFGEVRRFERSLGPFYTFRSVSGPYSAFHFDTEVGLILVGDHFVVTPWVDSTGE